MQPGRRSPRVLSGSGPWALGHLGVVGAAEVGAGVVVGVLVVAEAVDAGPALDGPVDRIAHADMGEVADHRVVHLGAQPVDRRIVAIEQVGRTVIGGQVAVLALEPAHQLDQRAGRLLEVLETALDEGGWPQLDETRVIAGGLSPGLSYTIRRAPRPWLGSTGRPFLPGWTRRVIFPFVQAVVRYGESDARTLHCPGARPLRGRCRHGAPN